MSNGDAVEMGLDECWEMLRNAGLGRLAFRIVDEVHITPVNFVVDGRTLLFRTAEGMKLLAAEMGTQVAFEVDEVGDGIARSVVVRGTASRLPEDQAEWADLFELTPWIVSAPKYDVVEIYPEVVTGRKFRLATPEAGQAAS
jgi:uncharacterized protein